MHSLFTTRNLFLIQEQNSIPLRIKNYKSELFYRTVNQNRFSQLFLRNINVDIYHITAPYVWVEKKRYQKFLKLNFHHN